MLSYNKIRFLPTEMTRFSCFSHQRISLFLVLCFSVQSYATENLPTDKPLIVSSIRPLAFLVESLAGDMVESEVLLPAGDSPHHLALRVSQVQKLQDADLVVWIGPEFERYLEKPLGHKTSLALASLLETQHGDEYGHGEQHLWLDPVVARAFVKAFATWIGERYPESKTRVETRAESFLHAFARAEMTTRQGFSELDGDFIAYHPALNEYVSAYKLKQVATVLEGSEHSPGVKRIADLKKMKGNTKCLLADTAELEAAKRYAALLELPIQEVDILGVNPKTTNWFEYYTALCKAVTQCLKFQTEKIPAPGS